MRILPVLVVRAAAPAASGAPPDDEANGAVRLLRDIASDYKNFLSIDTAETLGIGGFAAGATHAADTSIAHHVESSDPATFPGGNLYGSQLLQVPVAF